MKKSEYLELSAHEEKNIIAAISGYSEFITCGIVAVDKMPEIAEKIKEMAEKLSNFTDKRCLYEMLESDQYKLNPTSCNINDGILEAQIVLKEKFENDMVIRFINCSKGQEITCDRELLVKIIYSILENACRYSVKCSTITLIVKKQEEKIHIITMNESEPISAEDMSRLTEPYFRVNKEKSRQVGGQGLGLSIVKEIARVCNGMFDICFEDGIVKTTVTFYNLSEKQYT